LEVPLLKTSRFATGSEKKAGELDCNGQILPLRSICVPDAHHLKKVVIAATLLCM
jgi:hypothetical protein